MELKLSEILQATSAAILSFPQDLVIQRISTDSRKIQEGDLFVALVGETFNGHDYLLDVVKKGASALLVSEDRPSLPQNITIFRVPDTLKALGDMARYYRNQFSIPVVAITGSNGKTTTKELVHHILSRAGKTHCSQGNFNNFIGVPQTLFNMDPDIHYAVVEMGANHPGEIAYLSSVALPTLGIITNIAPAHLEGFGSLEGVQKAKGELSDYLKNKTLITNGDDPLCRKIARSHQGSVITYGMEETADIQGKIVGEEEGKFIFEVEGIRFQCPVLGRHHVYNFLAALGAARALDIPFSLCQDWKDFRLPSMRMEKVEKEKILFIKDCYNANPGSTREAISLFEKSPCQGRKILILGEMLELGEYALFYHKEMACHAAKCQADLTLSLGKNCSYFHEEMIARGAPSIHCQSHSEAAEILRKYLRPGDMVLLKGSRGNALEKILELWESACKAA